jgi:hypothetical protein
VRVSKNKLGNVKADVMFPPVYDVLFAVPYNLSGSYNLIVILTDITYQEMFSGFSGA